MSEAKEFIYCQDCGRIIYYDTEMKEPVTSVDDISAPPYITESGAFSVLFAVQPMMNKTKRKIVSTMRLLYE